MLLLLIPSFRAQWQIILCRSRQASWYTLVTQTVYLLLHSLSFTHYNQGNHWGNNPSSEGLLITYFGNQFLEVSNTQPQQLNDDINALSQELHTVTILSQSAVAVLRSDELLCTYCYVCTFQTFLSVYELYINVSITATKKLMKYVHTLTTLSHSTVASYRSDEEFSCAFVPNVSPCSLWSRWLITVISRDLTTTFSPFHCGNSEFMSGTRCAFRWLAYA